MRILQTNLGRARAAHDIANLVSKESKVDILVVAEPNKKIVEAPEWIKDEESDVAIKCMNKKIGILSTEVGKGYVVIKTKHFNCIACYLSPNITMDRYRALGDEIMNKVIRTNSYVIMGDLNAASPLWGAPITNPKGAYWAEWIATLDLVVHNNGDTPTFQRGESKSFIDVTISTSNLAGRIKGWRVSEEESLSLHNHIHFEIEESTAQRKEKFELRGKIAINREVFRDTIQLLSAGRQMDCKTLTKCIKVAQKLSLEKRNTTTIGAQPYWWNQEISQRRDKTNAARRTLKRRRKTRNRSEQEIQTLEDEYREERRKYKRAINDSKRWHWRKICEELENDVYGIGYKIVTRELKHRGSKYELEPARKKEIVRELFPQTRLVPYTRATVIEHRPFTREEVIAATNRLKNGRAAGQDGIMPETAKLTVELQPDLVQNIINQLFQEQIFPREWKEAKVVLIPKGSANNAITKYRTICLIDVLGKIYEHLVKYRLEKEIEEKGALDQSQFGFRKGRGTVDAVKKILELAETRFKWVALIMIDIKNAFNTASWGVINLRLRAMNLDPTIRNLIACYLSQRRISVDGEYMEITQGVPQGSVLGPTLWNVLYDTVLKLRLPEECHTVAYADDLTLVVRANNEYILMERANEAIGIISDWVAENKLELAPEKTEAVIVRGPRKRENVTFKIGDKSITPQKSVKCLGVHIDDKLIFNVHIREVIKKAQKLTSALARLLPNTKGPRSDKRRVLCGVVHSTLLYGAPIWKKVMQVKTYKNMLLSAQRTMLLRVASAYRTIATEALCVITGVPPIDLLVEERSELFDRKVGGSEARETIKNSTLAKWQRRWEENEITGQWTKLLIPNIEPWIKCQFRQVNYQITQFLSGHGSFRSYTFRIGKAANALCIYCGLRDTPEHTIIKCDRWIVERANLEIELGEEIETVSIINKMISNKQKWNKIAAFITIVMRQKEIEERREQNVGRV